MLRHITETPVRPPQQRPYGILPLLLTVCGLLLLYSLVRSPRQMALLADTPGMSKSVGRVPSHVQRLQAHTEATIALQPDLTRIAADNQAEDGRVLAAAGLPLLRSCPGHTGAGRHGSALRPILWHSSQGTLET